MKNWSQKIKFRTQPLSNANKREGLKSRKYLSNQLSLCNRCNLKTTAELVFFNYFISLKLIILTMLVEQFDFKKEFNKNVLTTSYKSQY